MKFKLQTRIKQIWSYGSQSFIETENLQFHVSKFNLTQTSSPDPDLKNFLVLIVNNNLSMQKNINSKYTPITNAKQQIPISTICYDNCEERLKQNKNMKAYIAVDLDLSV